MSTIADSTDTHIWPVDPTWEEQQEALIERETKLYERRARQARIYAGMTALQREAARALLHYYDIEYSMGAVLLAHHVLERLEYV